VQGSGFRFQVSRFRVQGLGFRVLQDFSLQKGTAATGLPGDQVLTVTLAENGFTVTSGEDTPEGSTYLPLTCFKENPLIIP